MPRLCPLLLISLKQPGNLITDAEKEWAKCLGRDCAWYVQFEIPGASRRPEGCAIERLSYSLNTIALRMITK